MNKSTDDKNSTNPSLRITHVINWVVIADEKPKTEWGDFLVCLENNSIDKANYSTFAGERWLAVGVGEICENNPIKYWAELPEPPCS